MNTTEQARVPVNDPTANALLRTRLAEQEGIVARQRDELDALTEANSNLWSAFNIAEARRAAAAMDASTSVRLMETAQKKAIYWQTEWQGLQALFAELSDRHDQTARQLAELLLLVGTETPIAAFSLAETWKTEKAGYMERIEALTLALDEQAIVNESIKVQAHHWKREYKYVKGQLTKAYATGTQTERELTVALVNLRAAAQRVVNSAGRDDNNMTPDTAAALRELSRCVSSNGAEVERGFETQAGCPHCGRGRLGEGQNNAE